MTKPPKIQALLVTRTPALARALLAHAVASGWRGPEAAFLAAVAGHPVAEAAQ